MEQDPRSPHCYVAGAHTVDPGDVGVFVGASDGMFCLSVLDRLSKASLFEPNRDWLEPLQTTMKPFGDKVQIVPLALGSKESQGKVRLDTFLRNAPEPNYLQIDVDGSELDVLVGAQQTLRSASEMRLSICTYHKRLDFPRFAKFLARLGYSIGHSSGFYLIGVRMPYLRRGVLYAWRAL